MKKLYTSIILLGVWLFFGFGQVAHAAPMAGNFNGEPWTIEICNQCYSPSDFESAASFMMFGKISVFNLSSGEVRTYQVNMGSIFPNSSLVPINTPWEALNAMQDYLAIKNALEDLDVTYGSQALLEQGEQTIFVQSSGFFGDQCGVEGSDLALLIPDWIFTSACFVHDECYREGDHTKTFCDDLFKQALKDSIDSATEELNFFLKHLSRLALSDMATVYYQAIILSPGAYNAYCSTNEDKDFCQIGYLRYQLGLVRPGTDGGTTSGSVGYNFDGISLSYNYTCRNTIITDGSVTWVREVCVMWLGPE